MTAVADAGPLIALAKVDALDVMKALFGEPVVTAPSVRREVVEAGLAAQAPDARVLESSYERGELLVRAAGPRTLPVSSKLGPGEEESIRLAIDLDAAWLLIDELDARRAAQLCFATAGVRTATRGTLGVLVAAFREGRAPLTRVLEILAAIRGRPDIWIAPELCDRVIALLSDSKQ